MQAWITLIRRKEPGAGRACGVPGPWSLRVPGHYGTTTVWNALGGPIAHRLAARTATE